MKAIGFISVLLFVAQAQAAIGSVIQFEGKAFIERSKNVQPITMNSTIEDGDIIVTGDNSLVVLKFKEHSQHKINGNTRLQVNDLIKKGYFELIKGSLISFITPLKKKKTKKVHFRVKTKAAVAGVRGTQFFISYGPKANPDDSWVCVNEGEVEVTNAKGGNGQIVKAGEGVSIFSKTQKVSQPKPLAWTKKINWNLDPKKGKLENKISIEDAYGDLLDVDYD